MKIDPSNGPYIGPEDLIEILWENGCSYDQPVTKAVINTFMYRTRNVGPVERLGYVLEILDRSFGCLPENHDELEPFLLEKQKPILILAALLVRDVQRKLSTEPDS